MPKQCTHFANLKSRISSLIDTFLSDQIAHETADPLSFTPNPDKLAAFKLLAHAEFEEFLEQKAREGLQVLSSKVDDPSCLMRSVPELLVISSLLGETLGITTPFDQQKYIGYAKEVLRRAEEVVTKNNGIKSGSFFNLAIFSGLMADEIDQTLSSTLNSYGEQRGQVAHRTVSRVRSLQTPITEANAAEKLVEDLQVFFDVMP